MAENGWESKRPSNGTALPEQLPAAATVGAEYDGELFRVGERKFRFVAAHWTEVKPRKPRTPKPTAAKS